MDLTDGVLIAISSLIVLGSTTVLCFIHICNKMREEPTIFQENIRAWE